MDLKKFGAYLKKEKRSQSAINRCISYLKEFEEYLVKQSKGMTPAEIKSDDLLRFIEWIESHPKRSAKGHLWGLNYYFKFVENEEMSYYARELREQRIERKPLPLKELIGISRAHLERLKQEGIVTVNQMLHAGKTKETRMKLANETGIPSGVILELVKLSELVQIPGVKSIRSRLYYDSGYDTLEKLAQSDPEQLRSELKEFVDQSGFDGIAPLPLEIKFTIEQAKSITKIIEY